MPIFKDLELLRLRLNSPWICSPYKMMFTWSLLTKIYYKNLVLTLVHTLKTCFRRRIIFTSCLKLIKEQYASNQWEKGREEHQRCYLYTKANLLTDNPGDLALLHIPFLINFMTSHSKSVWQNQLYIYCLVSSSKQPWEIVKVNINSILQGQ